MVQRFQTKSPTRRISGILGCPLNTHDHPRVALVRVPKRRLLSAKAAAQYLGIHQQTLKRITARGGSFKRAVWDRAVSIDSKISTDTLSLPLSA